MHNRQLSPIPPSRSLLLFLLLFGASLHYFYIPEKWVNIISSFSPSPSRYPAKCPQKGKFLLDFLVAVSQIKFSITKSLAFLRMVKRNLPLAIEIFFL
jgi:hypothetical protein